MLRLRTFGGLAVERDGVPVEVRRRGLAILAQLAVAGDRRVPRAKLLLRLWPDSDEERARNVLAQTLYMLKRELGQDDVIAGTGELGLNGAVMSSDVGDFAAGRARGDYAAAAAAYAGPFLDGFHLAGADEFERWAEEERAQLREWAADALESLARQCTAAGDGAGAVSAWRRLAAIDPLNSRVVEGLMRALADLGDPAGALRTAQVHAALLHEELGVRPDASVAALADTLRRTPEPASRPASSPAPAIPSVPASAPITSSDTPSSSRRPPRRWPRRRALMITAVAAGVVLIALGLGMARGRRAAPPPLAAPPATGWSIAVLPFDNLTGLPERDYVADGLTDEVTGALARVPGLRVVARTSAAAFGQRRSDIRGIARALDVQAVLEGSVRQEGSRLRIGAELISALDGLHLWSAAFDQPAGDLLSVQNDIARAIADTLRRQSPAIGELVVLRGTADIEAHDLYLRGRHAWNRRTRDGLEQAVVLFQGAIARDARYAEAYSGLADAYIQLGNIGGPAGSLDRAAAAAKHALQLDSRLSEAHVSRAMVLAINGDPTAAEREYQRAIELNPSYATAHHWYAILLQSADRGPEALTELRRAVLADPLSPAVNNALGVILYLNRDLAGAITQLRHTLATDSSFAPAAINLAQVEACAGQHEQALATLRSIPRAADEGDYTATVASIHALAGSADSARMLLAQMKREGEQSPYLIGAVHAVLGEDDSAFVWLAQTDWRQTGYLFLTGDPMLDPIRNDPRYARLLGRLGVGRITVPHGSASCVRRTPGE